MTLVELGDRAAIAAFFRRNARPTSMSSATSTTSTGPTRAGSHRTGGRLEQVALLYTRASVPS